LITIKVENNRYKVYINGEFRYEKVYVGFIDRLNGLDVFFNATEGYIDYQRVYSGDGELILAEEYDNACEGFTVVNPAFDCSKLPCDSAFTLYYNAHRGTSYNSAQVQQQYITHCGRAAKPCQPFDDEPTLCTDGELFTEIVLPDEGPCSDTATLAYALATEKYNAYKDSLNAAFENQYLAKCMQAYQYENFTVNAPVSEFHYTLYYYDQAGNLLKTVPPQGVDLSKYNWLDDWSDSVKTAKTNSQLLTPAHQLKTNYRYNTLNQVVAQHSPDGGESKFWYDRLGRLALSQNAKQKAVHASKQDYSYTRYDILGRIMEVGEINNDNTVTINDAFTKDAGAFGDWLTDNEDYRRQITSTYYDMPYAGFAGLTWPLVAKNLRNRVVFTTITTGNNPSLYSQGSFYSYDIHGNVDTLLQDYRSGAMATADQRFKKIVYKYDLISGKVNHVAYQAGETDQAYHRYSYDAENRLTKAEISLDSLVWEKDGSYRYLKHGPLSRTVLG
jgi:YD repeat-containing protein